MAICRSQKASVLNDGASFRLKAGGEPKDWWVADADQGGGAAPGGRRFGGSAA